MTSLALLGHISKDDLMPAKHEWCENLGFLITMVFEDLVLEDTDRLGIGLPDADLSCVPLAENAQATLACFKGKGGASYLVLKHLEEMLGLKALEGLKTSRFDNVNSSLLKTHPQTLFAFPLSSSPLNATVRARRTLFAPPFLPATLLQFIKHFPQPWSQRPRALYLSRRLQGRGTR